jgi:hypothetical protein
MYPPNSFLDTPVAIGRVPASTCGENQVNSGRSREVGRPCDPDGEGQREHRLCGSGLAKACGVCKHQNSRPALAGRWVRNAVRELTPVRTRRWLWAFCNSRSRRRERTSPGAAHMLAKRGRQCFSGAVFRALKASSAAP